MKLKGVLVLIVLLIGVGATTIYFHFYTIRFNGVELKTPYMVKKSGDKDKLAITKCSPDEMILILNRSKGVTLNDFAEKVLPQLKTEVLLQNSSLHLKNGEQVQILLSRQKESPQFVIVRGYLQKKDVLFTLYGTSSNLTSYYSLLSGFKYY